MSLSHRSFACGNNHVPSSSSPPPHPPPHESHYRLNQFAVTRLHAVRSRLVTKLVVSGVALLTEGRVALVALYQVLRARAATQVIAPLLNRLLYDVGGMGGGTNLSRGVVSRGGKLSGSSAVRAVSGLFEAVGAERLARFRQSQSQRRRLRRRLGRGGGGGGGRGGGGGGRKLWGRSPGARTGLLLLRIDGALQVGRNLLIFLNLLIW